MNSNIYYHLSHICFLCFGVLLFFYLLAKEFDFGEIKINQLPKKSFNWLERIVWGAKYIVKINDTWMCARGWNNKDGSVSVIFEPYKKNVINFEAGKIYESSSYFKVPLTWNENRILSEVIARNIENLKCFSPSYRQTEEGYKRYADESDENLYARIRLRIHNRLIDQ